MKTSMQILYDYIVEMEDNYMKMSKKSKDKNFKKGADAILTATTLIRVQMKNGGLQREKEQIMESRNNGIQSTLKGYSVSNEEYYNQTYNQNK
jgi:hypothetical protein